MKKICILLPFYLMHDSRSFKTVNVLNKFHHVDVYYPGYQPTDNDFFNENTRLLGLNIKNNTRALILKHSFFYNEFNYFAKEIIKQNIKYDYIWAHDLPVLKAALIIKKKTGAKVIYDCHEIYTETLNQFFPDNTRGIKNIILKSVFYFMKFSGMKAERNMIKKVDKCITVGQHVKEFLEKKLNYSNIQVLYNCPYLQNSNEKIDFHTLLGIDNKNKILLYQGVLNPGRALFEMIYAQQYTHDNIHFIIMGDGTLKKELEALVLKLNLAHKVHFIPRVHPTVLLNYTRGANLGIILQETTKNYSKKLGIANKFFEYIHAGIPFIATDAPENKMVYNKYKVCKLISPEHSIKEIAQVINDLAFENKLNYKEELKNAANEYNWNKQEDLILEMVK